MFSSDSPVSAFSIYKNKKSSFPKNGQEKKRHSKTSLLKNKTEIPASNKPKSAKKVTTIKNEAVKHSKKHKLKKKGAQKLLAKKLNGFHNDGDHEEDTPPILIPIPPESLQNHGDHEKDAPSTSILPPVALKNQKNSRKKVNKSPIILEKILKASSIGSEEENSIKNGFKLFEWLIEPVKPSEFLEKYWEVGPLYIKCKSTSLRTRFSESILNSSQLDRMFRDHPLYFTRNVDVVVYENGIKQNLNPEGRAVASALWDYYSNGCSIRVLNPQTYNKKIHLLVTTLQEYFGSMVGANLYLTPPGSQGFAPHYDDIEAFVVQLEGKKYWKLYKPKGADILARDSSPNINREDLDEEDCQEILLEAGDLLYFPRGVIHEGKTGEESHSLHITISVYQHNAYIDLLEHMLPAALKEAAQNDISFRRGLPLHYLQSLGEVNKDKRSEIRNTIISNVDILMKSLLNYVDVDKAADQLGRKLMHDSMPPVPSLSEIGRSVRGDGEYLECGEVRNRVEIGMDTSIRLLRYYCIRLVSEDDSYTLYYNTENANYYHGLEEQKLEVDAENVPVIKFLQSHFPEYVEIEKLPGDVTKNLQVISDLWERGIIVTEEPLMTIDSDNEESSSDILEDDIVFSEEHLDVNESDTE